MDAEMEQNDNYDMDADFDWFIKHQDELVRSYNGKILGIREGAVIAVGDTTSDVIAKANRRLGDYMIQLCIPGEEAYTTVICTPDLLVL